MLAMWEVCACGRLAALRKSPEIVHLSGAEETKPRLLGGLNDGGGGGGGGSGDDSHVFLGATITGSVNTAGPH